MTTACRLLLIGLFISLLAEPVFAVDPIATLPGRNVNLTDAGISGIWKTLSLPDKHTLAPFLIEYTASHGDSRRKGIIQGLFADETDSQLRAYRDLSSVYFETDAIPARLEKITLLGRAPSDAVYRTIVLFHLALEKNRNGDAVPDEEFLKICGVPDTDLSCRTARLLSEVNRISRLPRMEVVYLKGILQLSRPFLARTPVRPPFFLPLARELPMKVHALGLPLEAAIFAERMTQADTSALSQNVRTMLPYYLASAGDFFSASQFIQTSPGQSVFKQHARLDWLTLSGKYQEAIALISQIGPDRLVGPGLEVLKDYWMDFPYSPEGIRLRLAMLLYLAGDVRKAAQALELLTDMSGQTSTGEPAKYFARLRLAQILLKENPALAHKIAEDVVYISQEKGWEVLEYTGTIIDGWANYYSGNQFVAVVNFTKAAGILTPATASHRKEYSRLLGMLAAVNKIRPGYPQQDLINSINAILHERPYNQAVFTIEEWMPPGADPEFFLTEAMANMNARRNTWGVVNLLLEYSRSEDSMFRPGKNPGGVRGFFMSSLWSEELSHFSYMSALFPGARPVLRSSLAKARELLPRTTVYPFRPEMLRYGDFYVFSFTVKSEKWVFTVYPAVQNVPFRRRGRWFNNLIRTQGISFVKLSETQAAELERECTYFQNSGCAGKAALFESMRKEIRSGVNLASVLRVQYNPYFDIDYRTLLFSDSQIKPVPVYFTSITPTVFPGLSSLRRVFRTSCPTIPTGSAQQNEENFENLFSVETGNPAGIWLWPESIDPARNSQGSVRPVYLRNFVCGNSRVRLWDMDRFSGASSPALVVFSSRNLEREMDQAFTRFFSERGSVLLEYSDEFRRSDSSAFFDALFKSPQPPTAPMIQQVYRQLFSNDHRTMRLIQPGLSP